MDFNDWIDKYFDNKTITICYRDKRTHKIYTESELKKRHERAYNRNNKMASKK